MNPHSLLSDEIFAIELSQRSGRSGDPGLRDRVTACRKRVRHNRTIHKPVTVCNQSEEIIPEPDSAPSQSHQYTEEYSPGVGGRLVEEQEVGIT